MMRQLFFIIFLSSLNLNVFAQINSLPVDSQVNKLRSQAQQMEIDAQKARLAAQKAEEKAAIAREKAFRAEKLLNASITSNNNSQSQQASEKKTETKTNLLNSKYLAGAIPVEDGKVSFNTTIQIPNKDADWVYKNMLDILERYTKEDELGRSQVTLANEQEKEIVATFQEWMVFKSNFITLDRTKFNYILLVTCKDECAEIKLTRISYEYVMGADATVSKYKAEEFITDEYGLNKKKTKFNPITGKFRKETIDRKNLIFKDIKVDLLSRVE